MSDGTTEVSALPANETTGLPEVVVVNDQTLVKWTPKRTPVRVAVAESPLETPVSTAIAAERGRAPRPARATAKRALTARPDGLVGAEAAFRAAVGPLLVERGVARARAILDEIEAAVVSSAHAVPRR